jgi:hypothetical protein
MPLLDWGGHTKSAVWGNHLNTGNREDRETPLMLVYLDSGVCFSAVELSPPFAHSNERFRHNDGEL